MLGQYNGGQGLYHLDGNANDSSGSANNGSATNITWIGGKIGTGSASFNGSNSFIAIPDFNYNLPTSFTYNAFIYLNNYSDYNTIVSHDKGSPTANRGTLFRSNQTTGTLNFVRLNSAGSILTNISSTAVLGLSTWVMVTATFDNSVGSKIFINGVLVASDTVLTNTNDCTAPIGVGTLDTSAGTQNAMDGYIDEVIISNRAWASVEIKKYYTLAKGRFGL